MKKLLIVLFCLLPFLIQSKQIPIGDAMKVAQTLNSRVNLSRSNIQLSLVTTIKSNSLLRSSGEQPNLFYIFNIGNNNGYIIVAADDAITPIIGYTTSGNYKEKDLPPNYVSWMQQVQKAAEDIVLQRSEPTDDIKEEWNTYTNGNIHSLRLTKSVTPLIRTRWDQKAPYWNSIPVRNTQGIPAKTGCVATAMAQIMKYHEHPKKGLKTIPSYITWSLHSSIPTIDISQYSYKWRDMANIYGIAGNTPVSDKAVSDLMFHCGASVKMGYNFVTSNAYTSDVPSALQNYFGYSSSYIRRSSYSDSQWVDLMINNLNDRLPIYYDGVNENNAGHAFICDGYDINGLFHFNWGAGGDQDGYYSINATGSFNRNHRMIYDIKPRPVLALEDLNTAIDNDYHNVNEYIFEIIRESKNISLDPSDYDNGTTFCKLDWYIYPNWYSLNNGIDNTKESLILNKTYFLDPCDMETGNIISGEKSSFILTKEGKSTYKLRVNGPQNEMAYCLPMRYTITQRYGDPISLGFGLVYIVDAGALCFPEGWGLRNTSIDIKIKATNNTNDQLLNSITNIKIYDISGRLIYSKKDDANNFDINNTPLKNGIYIIEKSDGKNRTTEKINIKR
ncbi:MAG: thiol protease/hemagglutinin PrtT [Dysgonomonas sp.]|nr:thiol protease/hemagglutinin PrtT [Dysgonomonas sp.]